MSLFNRILLLYLVSSNIFILSPNSNTVLTLMTFIALSRNMCIMCCSSSESRTILFRIVLQCIFFGISILEILERIGFDRRTYISLFLLNLEVRASEKKPRFCGRALILLFFGALGWKGMLKFSRELFHLLITFGIGLIFSLFVVF